MRCDAHLPAGRFRRDAIMHGIWAGLRNSRLQPGRESRPDEAHPAKNAQVRPLYVDT